MKAFHRTYGVFSAVFLAAAWAYPACAGNSQAAPQPAAAPILLTNRFSPGVADVLKMSSAGVDKQVIAAFISNSPTAFNLSAEEVITLKQTGVPDDLLAAMLNHGADLNAQMRQSPPPSTGVVAPTPMVAPVYSEPYTQAYPPSDSSYLYYTSSYYPYYYPWTSTYWAYGYPYWGWYGGYGGYGCYGYRGGYPYCYNHGYYPYRYPGYHGSGYYSGYPRATPYRSSYATYRTGSYPQSRTGSPYAYGGGYGTARPANYGGYRSGGAPMSHSMSYGGFHGGGGGGGGGGSRGFGGGHR